MSTANQYHVIIIGGSYAGLAAGMALGRALRKVLIIDSGNPCNKQTPHSHNFLTNDGKTPKEIARLAKQQVSLYDTIGFVEGCAATAEKHADQFEVKLSTGEKFVADKLIFATGIKDIMPDIPGFSACWGITVLHCPYCHGYEVRHQTTGLLANGEPAFEFASLLANWTHDLTMYTNGKSLITAEQSARLSKHNISIVEDEMAQLEHQDGQLRNIVFKSGGKVAVQALYAKIPFEQHSSIPKALGCEINAEGYLVIDAMQQTTVPGVFACGDNVSRMRTVANAVSMGTAAGLMVNKQWVEERF